MINSTSENEHIILIVDDSPDTLGMINAALESENMTTLVALDGHQAIKIAQKMKPDVILLDALMPNLDGFETCKMMKAIPEIKDIPIIFMTGLTDTDSIVKGIEAGSVDYLTKPISPKELIVRINRHLSNARTMHSAQMALDIAGNNLLAIDESANEIWSTPLVSHLLNSMDQSNHLERFQAEVVTWLKHKPNIGSRLHFKFDGNTIATVFFGNGSNQEIMLRLIDENTDRSIQLLREHFKVTKRESDVFFWLAQGKANREIALILEMSPRTVNKHLEQLFKKLEVDNRTSAATKAIECLQAQGHWS
jgi:DNA-binding response OmpR family regulator/DNA-binding CsgD family transcriptional regulator